METESEKQPKKANKGTKKRRKVASNSVNEAGPAMINNENDSVQIANTKFPHVWMQNQKDSSVDDSFSPPTENGMKTPSVNEESDVSSSNAGTMPHSIMQSSSVTTPIPNKTVQQNPQFHCYENGGGEQNRAPNDTGIMPNAVGMNGPPQELNSDYYPPYGPNQTDLHYAKQMQPPYMNTVQRFTSSPSGATPTLNQLLTTPTGQFHKGHYPNYSEYPAEYNHGNTGGLRENQLHSSVPQVTPPSQAYSSRMPGPDSYPIGTPSNRGNPPQTGTPPVPPAGPGQQQLIQSTGPYEQQPRPPPIYNMERMVQDNVAPDFASGSSNSMYHHQSSYYMRSQPGTPQPPRTPGSQTSAGSSLSSGQTRNNPLSPVPVRPSTPCQQPGSIMKSPDNSPAPMSGFPHNRHMQHHSYGPHMQPNNSGTGPNFHQNAMMSPQHGIPLSQNQQHQHYYYNQNRSSSGSHMIPPFAVPKPSPSGFHQSPGGYVGQQQPGYPAQNSPIERRPSWQGPHQQAMTPKSPQHQMPYQVSSQNQLVPSQRNPLEVSGTPTPYSDHHLQPQVGSNLNTSVSRDFTPNQFENERPSSRPLSSSEYQAAVGPNAPGAISGAAAAAAAAMAAAAQSAKARNAFQKHSGLNYNPSGQPTEPANQQTVQPSPQQRAMGFHPNYNNVQAGSSSNPLMQPENFPQQTGYDPAAPGQPPHHAYDGNHPQLMKTVPMPPMGINSHGRQLPTMQHPRMPSHPAYPPMHNRNEYGSDPVPPPFETPPQNLEDRPKIPSSARSASQKLSALYEPDEPGRKDFIDRVLQYWEDKELPLKHAPLMGRRTLDLFTLYQLVKKKGFMQEVTRAKEWVEISNIMGLGNSSTSGFTLKKQYCKYLYGLECQLERGEQEPQEALARIIEANRKKKQAAEQQQAKSAENQMEQKSAANPGMQPQPAHHMQYGSHFVPGHYPPRPDMPGEYQNSEQYRHMPTTSPGHTARPYQYQNANSPATSYAHHQYPPHPFHPQRMVAPPRPSFQQPQHNVLAPPNQQFPPFDPSMTYNSNSVKPSPLGETDTKEVTQKANEITQNVDNNSFSQSSAVRKDGQEEPAATEKAVPPQSNDKTSSETAAVTTASETNITEEAATAKVTSAVSEDSAVREVVPESTKPPNIPPPPPIPSTPQSQNTSLKNDAATVESTIPPHMTAHKPAPPRPPQQSVSMSTNFRPHSIVGQPPYYGGQGQYYYPSGHNPHNSQENYGKQGPAKVGYDMHRMGYPPRPPPSSIYPYPSGSPAHIRQSPAPHHLEMMPRSPLRRQPPHRQSISSPSQPLHKPLSSSNMSSGPYHPQYSMQNSYAAYSTPSSDPTQYIGMKRSFTSSDTQGPPMKIMRPEMMHHHQPHYGPSYGKQGPPMYSRNWPPDSYHGGNYPQGPPKHNSYGDPRNPHSTMRGDDVDPNTSFPPPNSYHGMMMHHPPYHGYRQTHPNTSPANPASVYSGGRDTPNSSKRWKQMPDKSMRYQSSMFVSDSASKTRDHHTSHPHTEIRIPKPYTPPSNSSQNSHLYQFYPRMRKENFDTLFPSDSIEAAQPKITKFRRKTCRDVGVIEAWKIIMSLKSGLLAESTWALNALTILLHDQKTIGQIVLSQLPGLLHAVADHYRSCLKELFNLEEDFNVLSVGNDENITTKEEEENIVHDCQRRFHSAASERTKEVDAPFNLQSILNKQPVKLINASDANVMDKEILWGNGELDLAINDISYIVPSYSTSSEKQLHTNAKTCPETKDRDIEEFAVVEVTLEEILSVPSYIRCHQNEEDIWMDKKMAPTSDQNEVKKEAEPSVDQSEKLISSPKPCAEEMPEVTEKTTDDCSTVQENMKQLEINHSKKTEEEKRVKNRLLSSESETNESIIERNSLHLKSCLERYFSKCDVILMEDESAGFPGDETVLTTRTGQFFGGNCGRPLRQPKGSKETELMQRVLCLSNLIRSLSCNAINHSDLCHHKSIIKSLSCTLLLRHKHRIRSSRWAKRQHSLQEGVKDVECDNTMEAETDQSIHSQLDIKRLPSETFMQQDDFIKPDVNSPQADEIEKSIDPASIKQEPILENGLNENCVTNNNCDRKNGFNIDSKTTGKNLNSKNRNINDLCRKLRSSQNLPHITMEQENALIQNKFTKNHDIDVVADPVLKSTDSRSKEMEVLSPDHKSELMLASKLEIKTEKCKVEINSNSENVKHICNNAPLDNVENPVKVKSEDLLPSNDDPVCKTGITDDRNSCSYSKKNSRRTLFSSIILDPTNTNDKTCAVYNDPWWWECAQQVREDSFVTLANLSTYMDLPSLPDDEATLTLLDSCLHWAVCPSAEAQDAFSTTGPSAKLSPLTLVIEILTKLSMKARNVDLILAMRPYSRLETLFNKLITMVGNRKDQKLREFSIVLLSNLSVAKFTAARAIALQKGAVSNLVGFLEECEETGLNNCRMFPAGQERINCGTVPYMMERCSFILLRLAKIPENKPLFLKHQLRILSLSMSSLLDSCVLSLLSSTLFELSKDSKCNLPNSTSASTTNENVED